MKNLSLLFIAFLFLPFKLLAQEGWHQQYIAVPGWGDLNLYSVVFLSNSVGWAAGGWLEFNIIIHTTDGGTNWVNQSNYYGVISSLSFVNENIGWASTFPKQFGYFPEANILKTTDGGENWTPIYTQGRSTFYDVIFIDDSTGWTAYRTNWNSYYNIDKTTDGGATWTSQYNGISELYSLHFINSNYGWVAGGNLVKHTTNGGLYWEDQTLNPTYTSSLLRDVQFIDENTGWTVGWKNNSGYNVPVLYKTTDGGTNWIEKSLPITEFGESNAIHFTDVNNGWIVGMYGDRDSSFILHTTNGGDNWVEQEHPEMLALYGVFFMDSNEGWTVGDSCKIHHTTTGGVISVELTLFNATSSNGYVTLIWITVTETNNSGFEIERKQDSTSWERIGFVAGHGTTTEPKEYSYADDISNVTSRSLAYRLKQIDFDGSFEYSDIVYVDNLIPADFTLHQNYPNPFNPSTKIKYSILKRANVLIRVYDILGNEIETLVNKEKLAGTYEINWNAENLPSGVYFYQLKSGGITKTNKMLYIK